MCGILGLYTQDQLATNLYQGLLQLQHRGQDGAGLALMHSEIACYHGQGLVETALDVNRIPADQGQFGIGHLRYATSGGRTVADLQPFCSVGPAKLALAHSGHIRNAESLALELGIAGEGLVDSAILTEYLQAKLSSGTEIAETEYFAFLLQRFKPLLSRLEGAYSLLALLEGRGLIALRDPEGIRPLVLGRRKNPEGGYAYLFASESKALAALGFEYDSDLAPGELAYINQQGQLQRQQIQARGFHPCAFEYVYFANAESRLDGRLVAESRRQMGAKLALAWQKAYPDCKADLVVPVPQTANIAAAAFAAGLGLPYVEALSSCKTALRSFLQATAEERDLAAKMKLRLDPEPLRAKQIILVDDSLVRGSVCRVVVPMLRAAGVKSIALAIASPPIRQACHYGINIPDREELLAADRSTEAIRQQFGLSHLLYLSETDLVTAISGPANQIKPCLRCMVAKNSD